MQKCCCSPRSTNLPWARSSQHTPWIDNYTIQIITQLLHKTSRQIWSTSGFSALGTTSQNSISPKSPVQVRLHEGHKMVWVRRDPKPHPVPPPAWAGAASGCSKPRPSQPWTLPGMGTPQTPHNPTGEQLTMGTLHGPCSQTQTQTPDQGPRRAQGRAKQEPPGATLCHPRPGTKHLSL